MSRARLVLINCSNGTYICPDRKGNVSLSVSVLDSPCGKKSRSCQYVQKVPIKVLDFQGV